jgi:hypothetical protein
MQSYVIRQEDFRGHVNLSLQSDPPFYEYSVWRDHSGEHLFDGAAGDLAEAVDTVRAHMQLLVSHGEHSQS